MKARCNVEICMLAPLNAGHHDIYGVIAARLESSLVISLETLCSTLSCSDFIDVLHLRAPWLSTYRPV